MKNTLTMKQPSAFFGQPWREATPIGNGLTGALVYGGTASEHVLFNRFDCWHNANICEIPMFPKNLPKCESLWIMTTTLVQEIPSATS